MSQPKRILIGLTRSDTIVAGGFKHINQLGNHFRAEGAEVLFLLGGNGQAADFLEQQGHRVVQLPSLARDISPLADLRALLKIIATIAKFRPAVCSWHTAKIGALGRIASALTLRKSFYVPHGVPFYESEENPSHRFYARLEKLLSYLPTTIIGVCNFDKQQYLKLGVPASKVKVILNGMAPRQKINSSAPRMPVRFITAARFESQKDYKTLAAACEQLYAQQKSFTLDIYGDGPLEEKVKSYFQALPSGVIRFKGVVPNFAEALEAADVYVLSSFWEGLPRSIIEAMSCGKPIIATDVGGCSELVDHKNGIIVKGNNSSALATAMLDYIENLAQIRRHGDASLIKFNANFRLERMVNEYYVLYEGTHS